MPNLNDPIWSVIGVIATIAFGIPGIIGVIIAFFQLIQNRKHLSYRVLSVSPILHVDSGYKDKVEIRFAGKQVKNAYLVVVSVVNSGMASIRTDEYEAPLMIMVRKGVILSADIRNRNPKSLKIAIASVKKNSITLNKALLNSKDSFEVHIVLSDFTGNAWDLMVTGRIDGLKDIIVAKDNGFSRLFSTEQLITPFYSLFFPLYAFVFFNLIKLTFDLMSTVTGIIDRYVASSKRTTY